MEVALDAPQLGGGVLDRLGPGLGQHLRPAPRAARGCPGSAGGRRQAAQRHQLRGARTTTAPASRRAEPADTTVSEIASPTVADTRAQASSRQVIGSRPRCCSRRSAGRPVVGQAVGRHRVPEGLGRHRAVPVGDPPQQRQADEQDRDPDDQQRGRRRPPRRARRASSVGTASSTCASGVARQPQRSRSCCHVPILTDRGAPHGGVDPTPAREVPPAAARRSIDAGGRSRTRPTDHTEWSTAMAADLITRIPSGPRAGAPSTRGARSSPGSSSSARPTSLAVLVPTPPGGGRRLPHRRSPAARTRWPSRRDSPRPGTEVVLLRPGGDRARAAARGAARSPPDGRRRRASSEVDATGVERRPDRDARRRSSSPTGSTTLAPLAGRDRQRRRRTTPT